MVNWIVADAPGAGYIALNTTDAQGAFIAHRDVTRKRCDVISALEHKLAEPFTNAVIGGAVSAGALLSGYGVMLILAPCPACKTALYAGLVATQGIGGIGTLLGTANVIGRYTRRRALREIATQLSNTDIGNDTYRIDKKGYEEITEKIARAGLEDAIRRNEQLGELSQTPTEEPAQNKAHNAPMTLFYQSKSRVFRIFLPRIKRYLCKKEDLPEAKKVQAEIARIYLELETIARTYATGPERQKAVYDCLAATYSKLARAATGRTLFPTPRQLIITEKELHPRMPTSASCAAPHASHT